MAGIGFRLQKLLKEGTYRGLLEAYIYSALVSTGPWLLSVLGLAIVGALAPLFANSMELLSFRSIVIYTYAGSLILTGPLQLGTTRYIADRLFVDDLRAFAPCYHWVSEWVLVLGTIVSGLVLSQTGFSPTTILGGVVLFQAVCLTWIGMIFLSAAKDYMAIVRAFALSHSLSMVLALTGAEFYKLEGMIWGYATGQAILAWLLAVRIRVEFPSDHAQDSLVAFHWKKLPALALIGFFYNLGIWIDKILFWYSSYGETVAGIFRISPRYDTCMFFAYLSIVPAMSLFLIRIETGFYKQYAAYFDTIVRGASLTVIEDRKKYLVEALWLSVTRLLKLQGVATLVCFLLAPSLIEWLTMHPADIVLLRIGLLAAMVQVFLLILMIILLYFDWQADVARLTILFFGSNVVLTMLTFYLDPRFHGFGYLLACLVTLVAGLFCLEKRLQNLEFDTFTRQSIRA